MPVSVLTRKFSKTKKNPVRLNCVETTDYTIKSAVNPGYMIWYTGFVQFAICTVFPLAVSLPFVQLYSHSLLILLRRGFVWRKYQEGEWSFTSRKRKEERDKRSPFCKNFLRFLRRIPRFHKICHWDHCRRWRRINHDLIFMNENSLVHRPDITG